MILFVGSEETGYFAGEVSPPVKYTGYQPDITKLPDTILKEPFDAIIFNVEQFINDIPVITETIKRIRTVSNRRIIIMASGYPLQSEIVQTLIAEDFRFFILGTTLGAMKEDLRRCIRGEEIELDPVDPVPSPEREIFSVSGTQSSITRALSYQTAAFAGCCSRIGTTTQAIQFIKYLQLAGYKACYIEMNESGYVQRLGSLYSVAVHDQNIGCVSYQNIDLYYKKSRISEILKLEYDYYIYDFGHFEDPNFSLAFFLEKQLPVAVMGSSPNEFDALKATRITYSVLLIRQSNRIFWS